MRVLLSVLTVSALALTTACVSPGRSTPGAGGNERPKMFTIVPDDYHVPHAGTAEDGRKFFLSGGLFDLESTQVDSPGYVGLFLWHPDGTFDQVRVDRIGHPEGLRRGQAEASAIVERRLRELGDYRLEPITVEPFMTVVDGVRFGWEVDRYEDGTYFIGIRPGDFIVYYSPWDGREYDT